MDTALAAPGKSQRLQYIRERINSMEMPDSSIEEWRYSGIDELDLSGYALRSGIAIREVHSDLSAPILEANGQAVLVRTRNGEISTDFAAPDGMTLGLRDPEDIPYDFSAADIFSHMNALLGSSVSLSINAAYDSAVPVIVIRELDSTEATAVFPNLCIKLEPGAAATVIELLLSPNDANVLAVPVTKIFLEKDSHLEFLLIQDLGSGCNMIGHQISRLMSGAKFSSMSILGGGAYSRLFTTSTIAGAGAESNLDAAYFGSGNQVLDFRTRQEHAAKSGRSELYFKGAAANDAHLVYSGLIKVDKGATSTDAFQTNKNLVLSEGAKADSVPNLDIEENDVRCSHASSVGPVDEEQQYYLESRGIEPGTAQRLIVSGFFSEMSGRSKIAGVREALVALTAKKWKDLQR